MTALEGEGNGACGSTLRQPVAGSGRGATDPRRHVTLRRLHPRHGRGRRCRGRRAGTRRGGAGRRPLAADTRPRAHDDPLRAPERADQRAEDIARTIGSESGKTITGATATVSLVTTGEAERVERAIAQAGADGARTLTGGERDGTVVSPAVVADVDLRELAAAGDVLTPYAPLGEETRHLADEPLLARVKPAAVLVTCGRGGLLGPDADLAALESAGRRVWDWTRTWRRSSRPAGGCGTGRARSRTRSPPSAVRPPRRGSHPSPDGYDAPGDDPDLRRRRPRCRRCPRGAAAGRGRRLRPEPQKGHSMTTTP